MKLWKLLLVVLSVVIFAFSGMACAVRGYLPTESEDAGYMDTVSPDETDTPPEVDDGEEESKPYEPFIPGIMDFDPDNPIGGDYDFSTVYDYTGATLKDASGTFVEENGAYTAQYGAALYVNRNEQYPFPYGTLSADVISKGTDTGIVFGLSANRNYFWEGSGISYYFFFVSQAGRAYLGKADNGGWAALSEREIPNYSGNTKYNVKVIFKGNKILCYIDGQQMLSYADSNALAGTGWGIRAGGVGATISNVQISSSFIY